MTMLYFDEWDYCKKGYLFVVNFVVKNRLFASNSYFVKYKDFVLFYLINFMFYLISINASPYSRVNALTN